MSGHSKWSTIKHQKGAVDAKRGKVFSKAASDIALAAREGGGNPEFNNRLRLAIALAKAANMPKDNIDRAIKRGTGEGGGVRIEEALFEGYGPGGVAVMVQAVTDNRNRTSSDIRALFTKFGGHLGGNGAVSYLFHKKGLIHCSNYSDELELTAIDEGALDTQKTGDGFEVTTPPTELAKITEVLKQAGAEVSSYTLTWIPKATVAFPTPEQENQALNLFHALNHLDDIIDVASNAEFSQ